MNITDLIKSARGDKTVDLLLTNARIINVFSGKIISDSIAVTGGYITGFGNYTAKKTMDLHGRFVSPGFIDAHVHIESSMMCVSRFASVVLRFGTTTVVADPHEIANVLGIGGISYMLRSAKGQPVNIYFTLPSCVPATGMETSGATLMAEDLLPFMGNEKVLALAEMMNFPGVIHTDPMVIRKITAAKLNRIPVDGHAPGLTGKNLYAYVAAGITSDHECTTVEEAGEKLDVGMHIMIREGTGAKNLDTLLPLVNSRNYRRMMWCTDDRHPHDLLEQGHIDSIIRRAIQYGLDPVIAIQMATINPAEYFGIHNVGAIAPGRQADMVVFSDIEKIDVEQVFSRGVQTVADGAVLSDVKQPEPILCPPSMFADMEHVDFSIPAESKKMRVINILPGQIITKKMVVEATISDEMAVSDISRDILKVAVVERHTGSANTGKGFVSGFGLKKGALASSVAHDSHNIIVVGTGDADMESAVSAVIKMGGGLAAVCDSKVYADIPLPVAGLMSQEPVQIIRSKLDHLINTAHNFGTTLKDPFMTLSFLALPVIPELKITDKGLVDVARFEIVSLFEK